MDSEKRKVKEVPTGARGLYGSRIRIVATEDTLAAVLRQISKEAYSKPEIVKTASYTSSMHQNEHGGAGWPTKRGSDRVGGHTFIERGFLFVS